MLSQPFLSLNPRAQVFAGRAGEATWIDPNGVLQTAGVNVPRYQGGSLLVEAAATNLFLQSNGFNLSPWDLARSSLIANAAVAPDGTNTAFKIVEDTSSIAHAVYQSYTASGAFTISFFLKAAERRWGFISGNGVINPGAIFDLVSGVVTFQGGGTGSIAPLGNGWYRCSFSMSNVGGENPQAGPCNSATVINTTGDGVSGIYAFGAQLEVGSTSYIPTTNAPVTRAADQTVWQ
jgi:hypothetical protein